MNNSTSFQNKLEQIISCLNINYNLIGEDIADILWLALKQKEYSNNQKPSEVLLEPSQIEIFIFFYLFLILVNTELYKFALIFIPKTHTYSTQSTQEVRIFLFSILINTGLHRFALLLVRKLPPPPPPKVLISPPPKPQENSSANRNTIPLRHPDPPSLQQPLDFARTFRPLMRRVDSGRKTILDEIETVEHTAEQGICIPILKSESEPWLDLALVVDENSSMIIWRKTVKELKQILEHYGIFRKVRIWGLTTDKEGKITLRSKVGKRESFKNPQQLIDPTHRRLILIVSDCVASIWFDGRILPILEDWTKHQVMAIVQMLPNSMWLRTGLRNGYRVELNNLIPGAANRNLQIHELLLWKDIDLKQGTKIPVLTLNPEATSLWSELVVGKSESIMPGFVLPSKLDFNLPQLPQNQVKELNAEQRVKRFRQISSPLGRKLASLLMAAPVITLPVVRLIQKTLLPQSQPVHVAEVFLGGLLKPLAEITTETNPDGVLFEVMHDDIRNTLLDDAPFSDSLIIFETISDYIESNIGKSLRECVGLLGASVENEKASEKSVEKAYAEISLKVLKRLGGEYADFAEDLENNSPTETKTPSISINLQDFPPIENFEFRIPATSFKETTEILPGFNLQSFTFESATIELKKSGLFGRNTEVIIHRHPQQSQYFIEDLGNGIELEMVLIPGGTFTMGASKDEKGNRNRERPRHQVTVPIFFMGRYQVTQAQWRAVANLPQVERKLKPEPSRFKGNNLPVEKVSWYDAVEFCARLSNHTGREYRLPSEAEWEYACRAGTTTPFHFGETIAGDLANYRASSIFADEPKGEYRGQTTPVGQFPPNGFGLHDMHGNVWEWCFDDWHDNYEGAPTGGSAWVERQDENDNRYRVLRGGSWYVNPEDCRSAYRSGNIPVNDDRNNIGLRVVCGVAPRTQ